MALPVQGLQFQFQAVPHLSHLILGAITLLSHLYTCPVSTLHSCAVSTLLIVICFELDMQCNDLSLFWFNSEFPWPTMAALPELLAERDEPDPGKNLKGLAALWEKDETVRRHVLAKGSLLNWPEKKLTGVITFETLALNGPLLSHLLTIWIPQNDIGKTVHIDHVREEA